MEWNKVLTIGINIDDGNMVVIADAILIGRIDPIFGLNHSRMNVCTFATQRYRFNTIVGHFAE